MNHDGKAPRGVPPWLILARVVSGSVVLYFLTGVVLTSMTFLREGCDDPFLECAGLFTAGVFLWPLWMSR